MSRSQEHSQKIFPPALTRPIAFRLASAVHAVCLYGSSAVVLSGLLQRVEDEDSQYAVHYLETEQLGVDSYNPSFISEAQRELRDARPAEGCR